MSLVAMGVIASGVAILAIVYWTRTDWNPVLEPTGYIGDAKRGERLVADYGCTSCHIVPGASPRGLVGPPLEKISDRSYIAGHFANEEIWMTQWIEQPERLRPGTAMPDLHVGRRDSLDIAAYLATLH